MNDIAIVLPAYNEEMTIGDSIDAFHSELPDARIIVVDNNSSDSTALVAQERLSGNKIAGKVIHEPVQGKGNALRRAFIEIDADIYIVSDADLTYSAKDVHELMRPILESKADMVVGERISKGYYKKENKRRFHNFGNNLVRWLINKLFGSNLHDIMSGYRIFNRKFVKNYPILVEGFQVETDMTLHALDKRFRIIEIPVEYRDRPQGSFSKLNTFSDGASVIFTIAQIMRYYRPMAFFGSLTILLGVLGIISSIPVFSDWITLQYIEHIPLAILSVALELLAAVTLSVGLTLDSINHQRRMDYERVLLQYDDKVARYNENI